MSSHPTSDDTSADAPTAVQPSSQPYGDQQLELGEEEGLTALRRAWERTLRALAGTVTKQPIDNWLRPLKPLSYAPPVVVLGAASSLVIVPVAVAVATVALCGPASVTDSVSSCS